MSELVILDEVMKRIQLKGDLIHVPKPCDYFHLIGGTSTGGSVIISHSINIACGKTHVSHLRFSVQELTQLHCSLVAIMLGRLKMSTEDALKAYDSFASKIFSKANKNKFNLTERYGAVALEQAVQELVEDQSKGRPFMRDSRPSHAKGRAFVCTMPLQDRNTTVRLRTYKVEGDRFLKCKVYEAARATTAASTYFKPMVLKNDQGKEEEFVDAALGRNNPITVLTEEAISLFGTQRRLGCVVSLGTGSRKAELVQARAVREMGKQIVSLLKVMKEFTTDTRRDHEQMELKFKDFPGVYFRFDVEGYVCSDTLPWSLSSLATIPINSANSSDEVELKESASTSGKR